MNASPPTSTPFPVDDFGRDPAWIEAWQPVFERLMHSVFRIRSEGLERLPEGRAILVANHGGALPWDVVMLQAVLRQARAGAREIRPLIEDGLFNAPFLGTWLNRLGGVRASQENATRLLSQGECVAVFPEGLLGLGKRYRRRYKLQRFGRGGFVRLAIRTRTPIVPVAIVGAEDSAPLLARLDAAGRSLGLPYLPVTPLFPLLGPLGFLPLPARWAIRIGEPVYPATHVGDPDDATAVGDWTSRIRDVLQRDLRELQEARERVYPWSRAASRLPRRDDG